MTPRRRPFVRAVAGCLALLAPALAAKAAHAATAHECPEGLTGAWSATLPVRDIFLTRFVVSQDDAGRYRAEIRSGGAAETPAVRHDGAHLLFQSARVPVAFDGVPSDDGIRIGGFVQTASRITRLVLTREPTARTPTWTADWTPLPVREATLRLDLYIADDGGGSLGGYWFFRDERLPALWGYGLECREDVVTLGEKNLGLRFEGGLAQGKDRLTLTLTGFGSPVAVTFGRIPDDEIPDRPDVPERPARPAGSEAWEDRAPDAADDGWATSRPVDAGLDPGPLGLMVQAIVSGEMPRTDAVLIARHGRLVFEEYFYGFDRDTTHDMRSASKTLTSTLIGLAIREGLIPGANATALSFFPRYRYYDHWDDRKARITIKHLLTMSSGLDANDSDPGSVASEGAYQSQTERPDWIKLALDAPMIADPGARCLYGGANPMILGGILDRAAGERVEWFAHRVLFAPLGCESYGFFLDPTGLPYMGGGVSMRPRDMLKYGQLHLDGGLWQGRRILDEAWIHEAWGRYGRLEPLARNGHEYGYLWWHHHYEAAGKSVETVEARGNGGQYIFVVPALDMVVVITAGNYRTGLTRQPETLMQKYIVPAAIGAAVGGGPDGAPGARRPAP